MKILADASLPELDTAFPPPFQLTKYYSEAEIPALLPSQNVLLCRSTLKVNTQLIQNNPLQYVATASSGRDHIDEDLMHSHNIQVLDAKGCNALSVADYVLSCLAYLKQNSLLKGNKAGIVGMGKVGEAVYQRLASLGFQITAYDPLKSLKTPSFLSGNLADLLDCDFLCLHAELHHQSPYPSFNLINEKILKQLKSDCILINAARGGIVNEFDLLNSSLRYCTDVYLNEPRINTEIVNKATLCTPHIAGHSLEAKYAAVTMISEQLHHLIRLPSPQFVKPKAPVVNPELFNCNSWEEKALLLYNPEIESLILKNAENKTDCFLSLRKKHNTRHDFNQYKQ